MAIFLLPDTDPTTGEKTQYHQQFTLAETNIWANWRFVGQSGPIGEEQPGSASNNSYNPLVSFAYTNRINDQWVVGLDVGHPYQSRSNLPDDAITRFVSTTTVEEATDISPSISYQPWKWIAFGVQYDVYRVDAEIDYVLPATPGVFPETPNVNKLEDWGYGYHAGVLLHPFIGTLIGLCYYSKASFDLIGPSSIQGFPGPVTTNSTFIALSPTTRFRVFQALSKSFGLIGSADYTQWNTFQNVYLLNTVAGNVNYPFHFQNTWQYGLGMRYAFPQTKIIAGVAYDQAPNNFPDTRVSQPEKSYIAAGVDVEQNLRKNIKVGLVITTPLWVM